MKSLNLFCSLVLVGVLSACGGSSGSTQTITKIDIVGAASLFISGSASTSEVMVNSDPNTVNKLFKITTDGYVEEVTYTDKDGNAVTSLNPPVGVYNVDTDYVIVVFGSDANNPNESYLVRKVDGAVYRITGENSYNSTRSPIPMDNYFKNSSPVTSDADGNIYFFGKRDNYDGTVYKISNPSTDPAIEDYLPTTDYIQTFAANSAGNVFYDGYLASDSSIRVQRIKKLDGGLNNFSPYGAFWRAADGNVYYVDYVAGKYQIKKLTVDSSFNVADVNYGTSSNDLNVYASQSYLLNFSNKTLVVNGTSVLEVYNVGGTPSKVVNLSTTFNSVTTVTSSDTYYYIAGNNTSDQGVLKKCTVSGHSCSDMLTAGQYDIYAMVASSTNEVTFNALRMSDGAKVIAKVTDAGVVTVLDTTLNTQVTMLERVL